MGGREWVIRSARPEDAEAILSYRKDLLQEPGLDIPLKPEEITLTVDEERAMLDQFQTSAGSLYLIALHQGAVVGEINLKQEDRIAIRHVAELGMSVRRDWRGQGLGSALMAEAIEWARASPELKRIELVVYARNAAAIRLYGNYGFVREGIRRGRILENGLYLDDWIMALTVG